MAVTRVLRVAFGDYCYDLRFTNDRCGVPLGAGVASVSARRVRDVRAEYAFLRDHGG